MCEYVYMTLYECVYICVHVCICVQYDIVLTQMCMWVRRKFGLHCFLKGIIRLGQVAIRKSEERIHICSYVWMDPYQECTFPTDKPHAQLTWPRRDQARHVCIYTVQCVYVYTRQMIIIVGASLIELKVWWKVHEQLHEWCICSYAKGKWMMWRWWGREMLTVWFPEGEREKLQDDCWQLMSWREREGKEATAKYKCTFIWKYEMGKWWGVPWGWGWEGVLDTGVKTEGPWEEGMECISYSWGGSRVV